jgi:hypothetical protein
MSAIAGAYLGSATSDVQAVTGVVASPSVESVASWTPPPAATVEQAAFLFLI